MAGGITYADLRFARGPPENSQGEEPNEGEFTYENLQVSRGLEKEVVVCGPQKSVPELPCWATFCHCWRPVTNPPMLGVLALCLFLLATNIALGVEYLRASRQLQEASREHAAKSHVLGESAHHLQDGLEESRRLLRLTEQELNSTKQELNSTKQELNSTTVALWQSRAAGNQTRRQLQRQELQANYSLALLQTNLSQATSCRQIGCCPRGWTLFRWKCLWASSEWKTWEQSRTHCEGMSSQLLVLREPWSAGELWKAVAETFTQRLSSRDSKWFWVGLVKNKEVNWIWTWVDGSLYKGETLNGYSYSSYACLANGQLVVSSWKHRFICERAASPEEPPPSDWLWGDF